jgi:hypothetical protein
LTQILGSEEEEMNKKQRIILILFWVAVFLMAVFGTEFRISISARIIGIAIITIIASVLMKLAKDKKNTDSN